MTLRRRVLGALLTLAMLVVAPLSACTQAVSAAGLTTNDPARPTAPAVAAVPAGPFVMGSDAAEREAAYRLDEAAYGHSRTREWGWYDNEPARRTVELADYFITRTPITNAQYAAFVRATGHPAPDVDRATWKGYRLIHPYQRTRRHAWTGAAPPAGREEHPVVLVSHADARAYAAWLTEATGRTWRLPSEREWEKAARGADGRRFPWGDAFDAERLNSHDRGPFDTVPVGVSGRRQPLRPARCRRSGLRMDRDAFGLGRRALHRQGRLVGRFRLWNLPTGGPARPAGRPQTHPDRLSPGRGINPCLN
ncbi:MAG: SUMF1/EgtB/PvdO family nonheme iron enzyme [Proteobacteria bacterium]|nr:SUMF1/EgtB/PvdO family nonheme iron enzyme [Pseudomonadota bacterium]